MVVGHHFPPCFAFNPHDYSFSFSFSSYFLSKSPPHLHVCVCLIVRKHIWEWILLGEMLWVQVMGQFQNISIRYFLSFCDFFFFFCACVFNCLVCCKYITNGCGVLFWVFFRPRTRLGLTIGRKGIFSLRYRRERQILLQ